jgi:dipeptidyl aminopeptidase/acylaminoacyl peptidase
MNPREPTVGSVDEVWVVDTRSDDVRRLTGLSVSELKWAKRSSELALLGDGIELYSVASDEIRPLGGAGAQQFDWSPDGRTIAFTRPHPGTRDGAHDIWLMDADGTDERLLVSEINANHGVGPVWSPDGERIVYQQLCDVNEHGGPCREEHEVVLITVNANGDARPATQVVLPPPQTAGPDGPISWYPYGVVWSRDGDALLYWADAQDSERAIVAVPVDGTAPPVILSGDLTPSLYFGP